MTTELRDTILQMFVAKDDLRPDLCKPWNSDGCVGATNGHILVLLPGEDARYGPFKVTNGNNVGQYFPPRECDRRIDVLKLTMLLDSIPRVSGKKQSEVDCDQCCGSGECECMGCGGEHECAVCDGTGKVVGDVDDPTVMVPDDRATVWVGESLFSARYLKVIADTANALGVGEISSVGPVGSLTPKEFVVADARILIMPMRSNVGTDADFDEMEKYRMDYEPTGVEK